MESNKLRSCALKESKSSSMLHPEERRCSFRCHGWVDHHRGCSEGERRQIYSYRGIPAQAAGRTTTWKRRIQEGALWGCEKTQAGVLRERGERKRNQNEAFRLAAGAPWVVGGQAQQSAENLRELEEKLKKDQEEEEDVKQVQISKQEQRKQVRQCGKEKSGDKGRSVFIS